MGDIVVERMICAPASDRRVEIVERKGLGHPDSMCDGIMERVSQALAREYLNRFGSMQHYNMDKGLLVAGSVERRLGGGKVKSPMRLIFGDRATFRVGENRVQVHEIAVASAREWIAENLRFVDPGTDIIYQFEIRPGSRELQDLFRRRKGVPGANDTSTGVGFAPLTDTEAVVLQTELYLNSIEFKERFPETGEDVKVMAVRKNRHLEMIVAMPLIDRFVRDEDFYFDRKAMIRKAIREFVSEHTKRMDRVDITYNALDKKGRGLDGMYLSVLGTSAEDADSGEVGRGNRVNGLICFNRPLSMEAAAGKNALSHVGKIYNVFANKVAHHIYSSVPGLEEIHVWLTSEIGRRVDQPKIAVAQIHVRKGASYAAVSRKVDGLLREQLEDMAGFCDELIRGRYSVY